MRGARVLAIVEPLGDTVNTTHLRSQDHRPYMTNLALADNDPRADRVHPQTGEECQVKRL